MEAILDLEAPSQGDDIGRPLVDVYMKEPALSPYTALVPDVPLDQRIPEEGLAAEPYQHLDDTFGGIGWEDLFNIGKKGRLRMNVNGLLGL